MFALMDIWHSIQGIVHSADTIQLVLMAVIAIIAGFMMMELSSLISVTIIALIAYAIANFIYAIVQQHADVTGLLTADWKVFEAMTALLVLSYAIMFGVVIAAVSTVRGLVLG